MVSAQILSCFKDCSHQTSLSKLLNLRELSKQGACFHWVATTHATGVQAHLPKAATLYLLGAPQFFAQLNVPRWQMAAGRKAPQL
jgi:hypothetical protein